MRFLAIYTQKTHSVLRRVMAPFSVLAQRGHAFSFLSVTSFEAGLAYGHDVTVLPDWVLSEEELRDFQHASQDCLFSYDLSDPTLLENEIVRTTLRGCRLVTVPNEYLLKEVKAVIGGNTQVKITPSVIDIPYFMSARKEQVPAIPVIGCFGPHDWYLVKPALEILREKHPVSKLILIGDTGAKEQLGELIALVEDSVENHPALLRHCTFGLCPYEGYNGRETVWGLEHGIFGHPVITSSESAYNRVFTRKSARFVSGKGNDTNAWIEAITDFAFDPHLRATYGQEAFQVANAQRATEQAKVYLKAYAHLQMLLHRHLVV